MPRCAGLHREHGVGHLAQHGGAQREVLHVLPGAVPRPAVQAADEAAGGLLHLHPHHALRPPLAPHPRHLLGAPGVTR